MLLFVYVIYFLYSDEYLISNEEEMAWQYAVINSRFEPGLQKKNTIVSCGIISLHLHQNSFVEL